MFALDPAMTTPSLRLLLRAADEMIDAADPTTAECELDGIRAVADSIRAELRRRGEVATCPA